MNRAAGILAIGIGLLIAAGSVVPEAVAEGPRPGIVLAQAEERRAAAAERVSLPDAAVPARGAAAPICVAR